MSRQEAIDKGLQAVPKWWPIAMALISLTFGTGGAYAVFNYRLTATERTQVEIKKKAEEFEKLAGDRFDKLTETLNRIDVRTARIEGRMDK